MHLSFGDLRLSHLTFAFVLFTLVHASERSIPPNGLAFSAGPSIELPPTAYDFQHTPFKHGLLRDGICQVLDDNTTAQDDEETEGRRHAETMELRKRAAKSLIGNTPVNDDVVGGAAAYFFFPASITSRAVDGDDEGTGNSDLEDLEDLEDKYAAEDGEDFSIAAELKKRQLPPAAAPGLSSRTVFITINTCQQPDFDLVATGEPPQLILYVSEIHQEPGPGLSPPARVAALVEGFAGIEVNTTNDVYIGVAGPRAPSTEPWNFDIAASLDAPYHAYDNSTGDMYMIDSDPGHALLITKNLTSLVPPNTTEDSWTQSGPPLNVFVQNTNVTSQRGLSHSYCGLQQLSMQSGQNFNPDSISVSSSLSNYLGPEPEQQFYVSNLNHSSTYNGYLVLPNAADSTTPRGGGTVYAVMNFTTKRYANCAVIYNLSFCSKVAYAVPANPSRYADMASLAALYDNTTQETYRFFNYSLQQIACNTTATAQYSLAVNCDDCASAYKDWLCAVSMPRCTDWTPDPSSAETPWLQPRNAAQAPLASTDILPVTNATLTGWAATNGTRNNATIFGSIAPGPYSEILPCRTLCYNLVRSCPAALQFACPMSTERGLNRSYGEPHQAGAGLSCSEPGSVYGDNGAGAVGASVWSLLVALGVGVWVCL